MTPLFIGLSLIVLMLVVHRWTEGRALEAARPLNVDEGLPFPDLAQASSIFSLTALYTAYVTITLILGVPALVGLAIGGIAALVSIRGVIRRSSATSFEELVMSHLVATESGRTVVYVMIAAQIGFAASELVILREAAIAGFHMAPRHATVLMLSLVIVPYYYSLVGGYRALFRTDVIQFVAIGAMCAYVGWVAVGTLVQTPRAIDWVAPNVDWWQFGLARTLTASARPWVIGGVHVLIGFVMGYAFMAGTPDTWKRVFVAVKMRQTSRTFWRLVIAGALPFLGVMPVLALIPRPVERDFLPISIFFRATPVRDIDMMLVFGIVATFLSSFAGAAISATHLLLLERRARNQQPIEMPRFQILLGGVTLVAVFLALAFVAANPYFLGHLLLGLYAVTAGAMVGSRGQPVHMAGWMATAIAVLVGLWFMALVRDPSVVQTPKLEEMHAVPVGVAFFLVTTVVAAVASRKQEPG